MTASTASANAAGSAIPVGGSDGTFPHSPDVDRSHTILKGRGAHVKVSALALSVALLAALAISAPARAWPNTGTSLTVAQARAKLLAAPRLQAVDRGGVAFRFRYVFEVGAIRTLRPSGPSVIVNGKRTWRRFEVFSSIRLLAGIPAIGLTDGEEPGVAGYCFQVVGRSFRLTGFDTESARWGFLSPGCKDTREARAWVGGPYR